jgi:DNA-binding beta-propeller fold protein YncE
MAKIIERVDKTVPANNAVEVTPDDNTDLAIATRSIYVGNSGNLKVTMVDGNTVTFVNVPVGWHPIGARRIWQTGTTAATIVAAW